MVWRITLVNISLPRLCIILLEADDGMNGEKAANCAQRDLKNSELIDLTEKNFK